MRQTPDLPIVLAIALGFYLAIILIGFAGAALAHGLLAPLLALVGLDALFML